MTKRVEKEERKERAGTWLLSSIYIRMSFDNIEYANCSYARVSLT